MEAAPNDYYWVIIISRVWQFGCLCSLPFFGFPVRMLLLNTRAFTTLDPPISARKYRSKVETHQVEEENIPLRETTSKISGRAFFYEVTLFFKDGSKTVENGQLSLFTGIVMALILG